MPGLAGARNFAHLGVDAARNRMVAGATPGILEAVAVAGEPIGDILARQVRFAVAPGDGGVRLIAAGGNAGAPVFDAAQRLVTASDREIPGLARGFVGFTLSDSFEGAVANKLASRLVANPAYFDAESSTRMSRRAEQLLQTAPLQRARHVGGILDFGPAASAELTAAMTGTASPRDGYRAVATWLHEAEHAATRPDAVPWPVRRSLGWLEEGTTEVATRWPGRIERLAAAADIGVSTSARSTYQTEYEIVSELVRLLGIDPSDSRSLGELRSLLRETPLDERPRSIASNIGRAAALEGVDVLRLQGALRSAGLDFGRTSSPAIAERMPDAVATAREAIEALGLQADDSTVRRLTLRRARRTIERDLLRERLSPELEYISARAGGAT